MAELIMLATADTCGRNGEAQRPLPEAGYVVQEFFKKAQSLKILYHPEPALLTGKDFLDVLQPGPTVGKAVKKAYQLQINENISDKNILKERVLREFVR